jgi:nicotinate phosphoribosyltransferase
VEKCRVTADARAPIDVVGTGSFIRDSWHETYATADIIEYDGMPMVKLGAEFLLRKYGARRQATDQTRVRRRRASWGKPHVAYHPKQR